MGSFSGGFTMRRMVTGSPGAKQAMRQQKMIGKPGDMTATSVAPRTLGKADKVQQLQTMPVMGQLKGLKRLNMKRMGVKR